MPREFNQKLVASGVALAGRARTVAALGATDGLAIDGNRVKPARGIGRSGKCGDGQDGGDLLEHGFLLEKGHEEP